MQRFELRILEESGARSFAETYNGEPFWAGVDWPALPIGKHTLELQLADGRILRGFVEIRDLVKTTDALQVDLR